MDIEKPKLTPEEDSWQPLLDSLALFTADFMAERAAPPPQPRDDLFGGLVRADNSGAPPPFPTRAGVNRDP